MIDNYLNQDKNQCYYFTDEAIAKRPKFNSTNVVFSKYLIFSSILDLGQKMHFSMFTFESRHFPFHFLLDLYVSLKIAERIKVQSSFPKCVNILLSGYSELLTFPMK
jgi:hypothetical protein